MLGSATTREHVLVVSIYQDIADYHGQAARVQNHDVGSIEAMCARWASWNSAALNVGERTDALRATMHCRTSDMCKDRQAAARDSTGPFAFGPPHAGQPRAHPSSSAWRTGLIEQEQRACGGVVGPQSWLA